MKICRITQEARAFYQDNDSMNSRWRSANVVVGDIVVIIREVAVHGLTEALILSGRLGVGFMVYPTNERKYLLEEIE